MAAAVPADFECSWRHAAFKYAQTLQPDLSKGDLALLASSLTKSSNEGEDCNIKSNTTGAGVIAATVVPARPGRLTRAGAYAKAASSANADGAVTFYVAASKDGKGCSDSGAGTESEPLCTVQAGATKCRASSASTTLAATASPCTVILRGGVHVLDATIDLTPADSYLSFIAYKGESPIVTGAVQLPSLQWSKEASISTAPLIDSCTLYNDTDCTGGNDLPGHVGVAAASAEDCMAKCAALCSCGAGVWGATGSGHHSCYLKSSRSHPIAPYGHFKGNAAFSCTSSCPAPPGPSPSPSPPPPAPPVTIWKASLPTGKQVRSITSLLVNGQRAIRARYPNANPETDKFPIGYNHGGSWLKPKEYPGIKYISYNETRPDFVSLFQNYRAGVGGPCSVYDPPISYWCAEKSQGGGAAEFVLPSGLQYNNALPHGPYKNVSGAVLWSWRPGHWANWAFELDPQSAEQVASSTFTFARGGFQGGRGNKEGAEWYIENVREELDYPMEYFYDEVTSKLYYATADASPPAASTIFEAPQLKTLFSAVGTQQAPVKNVTFSGITFQGAAYTYMDPNHSPPSGGDWSLQRSAALFFEGTFGSTISACELIRLEGNGIMLSGFNQHTTIASNHIAYTGDSAIAGWGYTAGTDPNQPKGTGPDGTGGDFPRWTLIENNFIHHLGVHEKQSSCWFQAKTAETTLRGNICFDIPRAGFNLNDGFGGGTVIEDNLMFNTCGESGDHGAINTWDRQAFLTTVATGKPSYFPAVNTIHHNFIVSNGDADGGAIDNDDGSSYYLEHSNFCIYGGAKMANIDGHAKVYHSNINAYANVYGKTCNWQWPGWFPDRPYEEQYFNNTCILDQGQNYIKMPDSCSFSNISTIGTVVHGNKVFAKGGAVVSGCGKSIKVEHWLQLGGDKGTTFDWDGISSANVMAMGEQLLDF